MSGLVAIGTLALISTWLLGPSKGLYASERTGDLPPELHYVNKRHVPVAVLVFQGILSTLFALMFLFVPSINSSYWMLTALTTQILVMMYILIFAAAIRLRYTQPDAPRAYKIPGGKAGIWIVAGVGIFGSLFSLVIGFVPPSGVSHWPTPIYVAVMARADHRLLGAALHRREDQEAGLEDRPTPTPSCSTSTTAASPCRSPSPLSQSPPPPPAPDALSITSNRKEPTMLERHEFPVLFVAGRRRRSAASETLGRIVDELVDLGHRVVEAETLIDGRALVGSDPSFGAVVLDWDVSEPEGELEARAVLDAARRLSDRLPVFLMLDHGDATELSLEVLAAAREVVLVLEDTPAFIAGRIDFAWRRYVDTLLPPFFGALVDFANTYEYSMHTPGHAGGTAFRKTAVGKAFYDFYGENLFRTDLSVSVGELGSLLDHSGPRRGQRSATPRGSSARRRRSSSSTAPRPRTRSSRTARSSPATSCSPTATATSR